MTQRRIKRKLLLSAFLAAAGPAWSADTSRNPDRWVSIDFLNNSNVAMDQSTANIRNGVENDQNVSFWSSGATARLLVPLNNHWTFTLADQTLYSRDQTDLLPPEAGNTTITIGLTPSVSLRYYFLDYVLGGGDTSQNPDQWPSLALIGTGNFSTEETVTTVTENTSTNRDGATHGYTVLLDTRLPVTNDWTLLGGLEGIYIDSSVDQTPALAGTDTTNYSIGFFTGGKHYFLGRNLIHGKDNGQNPDRWSSLSVICFGGLTLDGTETITGEKTVDVRSQNLTSAGVSVETLLPVANSLTVDLATGLNYTQSEFPETTLHAGTTRTGSTVSFLAGIHYYFEP